MQFSYLVALISCLSSLMELKVEYSCFSIEALPDSELLSINMMAALGGSGHTPSTRLKSSDREATLKGTAQTRLIHLLWGFHLQGLVLVV